MRLYLLRLYGFGDFRVLFHLALRVFVQLFDEFFGEGEHIGGKMFEGRVQIFDPSLFGLLGLPLLDSLL